MARTISEGIEKKIPVGQIHWIDDKAFLCEGEGLRMKQPQSRKYLKTWQRTSEQDHKIISDEYSTSHQTIILGL